VYSCAQVKRAEAPASDNGVVCYDVLGELDNVMHAQLGPNREYYVLGGIVTDALTNGGTIIDSQSQTILAAKESGSTLTRDNGSRRDIDILVGDTLSRDEAKRIKAEVSGAIDEELVVSISRLDEHKGSFAKTERPKRTFLDWNSRRTIDQNGILRYELFPLQRVVDPASYDPWKLQLPDGKQHIQVLHPAGHMLAYAVRSISGIRGKDTKKFSDMQERLMPLFREEIHEGPFRAWLDFAGDIHGLLHQGREATTVWVRSDAEPADLAFFRAKGKVLGRLESYQEIVDLAQGPLRPVLDIFGRIV
jgi:hypothetical protein